MGDLDNILGATLSGVIFNAWVLGLIYVFSYQYYCNFPRDRKGTKLLVAWMWCLQTFNGIVVSMMIYVHLVTDFGVLENADVSIWEGSLHLGLLSLSAFSAQVYYAYLSKSYVLSGAILLLAFCQLGFGLATMSEAFVIVSLTKFISVTWICVAWLSFSAACDLLIAIVQTTYLHRYRSKFSSTNRIVNTLILYTISTGLLTSILAILELTTFAALGFNFVHVFLSIPTGAVYTISLLANLNSRQTIRSIVSTAENTADTIGLEFMHTKSNGDSVASPRQLNTNF